MLLQLRYIPRFPTYEHTSLDIILRISPVSRRRRRCRRAATPSATAHRSLTLATSRHPQCAAAPTAPHQIIRLVQQAVRRSARPAVHRATAQQRLASRHRARALRPQIGQRTAHDRRTAAGAACATAADRTGRC